ncbi:hypothetical protein AA637_15930 (plasmid) [Cyanobacterium sp. HL-69]|nr:hypothetical protein AA637_15930 [Cyanobacterium sp. HL-69]
MLKLFHSKSFSLSRTILYVSQLYPIIEGMRFMLFDKENDQRICFGDVGYDGISKRENYHKGVTIMVNLEQIQHDISELPEEAQTLVTDFIESLKKRYSITEKQELESEKTLYDKFEAIGLIGFCSVEEDLSTTYKQVLAETLETKYDHC